MTIQAKLTPGVPALASLFADNREELADWLLQDYCDGDSDAFLDVEPDIQFTPDDGWAILDLDVTEHPGFHS
jgi:hypothetical protein